MLDKDSTNPTTITNTTTKSNKNEDTPGEGNPENVTPSATNINEKSRGDSSRSDTLVIATYVANDDDDNADNSANVDIDLVNENGAAECRNGVESERNHISHLLSIVRLCDGPSTSAAQTRYKNNQNKNINDLSQNQSSKGTSDGNTSKTTANKNSRDNTTPLIVDADSGADYDDDELSIAYKNNSEMNSSKQQPPPPLPPRRPTISVKYFSPVEDDDDDVIMTSSTTTTIGGGMRQRNRTECDKNMMAGPSSQITQNLQLNDRKISFSTTNEMASTTAPVEIIDLELMSETRVEGGRESPANSSVISVSTTRPVRRMSMSAGRRMVCVKHIKRAPKEPEEYIEALFPHVREAHQRIRQALLHSPLTDVKDNALLKRKMLEVIQLYARGCKNEFERVGNSVILCRRLKRNIIRLLDLFNEICFSSRQDQVYLYHISQLIAVHNSLEIRLSLNMTRLQKCALIHRLAHVINKHLSVNDESLSKKNILRMFLHMPEMYSARFIMEPLFNTFLPEIHTSSKTDSQKELPDKTFVQYIVILYQWKEMLRDPLEQIELINKAQQFMCPTKMLHSNSIYANHLPTIHTRKNAVKDILNNLKFFHDLKNAAICDDSLQAVDEDIIVLIDEDTSIPVWDFGATYTAEPTYMRPKTQTRKFASEPVDCVDLTLDEDHQQEEKVENHLVWLTSLKEKASDNVVIDETENVICLDSDTSDGELFSGSILDPSESYQDCDAFDTDYTSADGSTTDDKAGSEDETLPSSRITSDGLRTYLAPRSRRNSHISTHNDDKRTTTYTRRSVHMGSPYVRTRGDGDGDCDGEGDGATVSRINSDSETPWPLILNTFTVGSKKSQHLSRFSRFSTDVRSEHFEDENVNEIQEQNSDEDDEDVDDDDDDVFHSLPSTASSSRTTMGKVIYSQALPESSRRSSNEQDNVHKGLKSAAEKLANLDYGRADHNGKQGKAKLDNESSAIEDSAMQLRINVEDKNNKPVKKQVKFNDKPIGPTRPLSTNDITKMPIKPAIQLNKMQCSQNQPCTNNQHCCKQKDYNQHNYNQHNYNQHDSNQHDSNQHDSNQHNFFNQHNFNQHNFNQHNCNQHNCNQHNCNQHNFNQHNFNQHCCNQQPIQSSSPKPRFASPTSSTTSSTTESLKHMAQQGRRILDRFKLSKTANFSKCSSATIIDSESDDIIDVFSSDSANKTDNISIISTQSLQIENTSTENELLDFNEKSISHKNSEYQMKTRSFSNRTSVMCRPKDISSTNNNNTHNESLENNNNNSNMHLNDDDNVDDNNDCNTSNIIQTSAVALGGLVRGKQVEIEEQNSNVSTTTGPNNESLTADEHKKCISLSKQTLVTVDSGISLEMNVGCSDICTSSTTESILQENFLECNAVSTQLDSSDDDRPQSGKLRLLSQRVSKLRGKTAQASKIGPLSTKKVVSKVRKRYTEVSSRKSTLRGASAATKTVLQKELLVDSVNKNISTKQNKTKSITEQKTNKIDEQNTEKGTETFLKKDEAAEEKNLSEAEIKTKSIAERIAPRNSDEKNINESLAQGENKKDENISTKQGKVQSITKEIPNKSGQQAKEKVVVDEIDENISTKQNKTKVNAKKTADKGDEKTAEKFAEFAEDKKEENISIKDRETKSIAEQILVSKSDEKNTEKVAEKMLMDDVVASNVKNITLKDIAETIATSISDEKNTEKVTENILKEDIVASKDKNITTKQDKTKTTKQYKTKTVTAKISSKSSEQNTEEILPQDELTNITTNQDKTKTVPAKISGKISVENEEILPQDEHTNEQNISAKQNKILKKVIVASKEKNIATKQDKTKAITAKLSSKSNEQNTVKISPQDEHTNEQNISKNQNKTKPITEEVINENGEQNTERAAEVNLKNVKKEKIKKPILEKIPSKTGEKDSEEILPQAEHINEQYISTKQNKTKSVREKLKNKGKEQEVILEQNISVKEIRIPIGQTNSQSINEEAINYEKSTEKNENECFTTEINQIDVDPSSLNVLDQCSFENLELVNEIENLSEKTTNSQEPPFIHQKLLDKIEERIAEMSEDNKQDTQILNENADTHSSSVEATRTEQKSSNEDEEIAKLESESITHRTSDQSETVTDEAQKPTTEKIEVNVGLQDETAQRQSCDVMRSDSTIEITLGGEAEPDVKENKDFETSLDGCSSKIKNVLDKVEVQKIKTIEVDNTAKKLQIVMVEQPQSQTATCSITDEISLHQSHKTEKTENEKTTVKILKKVTSDKIIKEKQKQQEILSALSSLKEKSKHENAGENKIVLRKSTRKTKSKSEQSTPSESETQTEELIKLRKNYGVGEKSSVLEEKIIPCDITQSAEGYAKCTGETSDQSKTVADKPQKPTIEKIEVNVGLQDETALRQSCDVMRSDSTMEIALAGEAEVDVTEKDFDTSLDRCSSKIKNLLDKVEPQKIKTIEVGNTAKKLHIVVVEQPQSQSAKCSTTEEKFMHQSHKTEKTEIEKPTVKILKKVTSDKIIKEKQKQQAIMPASNSLKEKSEHDNAEESKIVLRKSTRKTKSKSKSEQSTPSESSTETEERIKLGTNDGVGGKPSELEEKIIPCDFTQSVEGYAKFTSETGNIEKYLKLEQILTDGVTAKFTEKTELERKLEPACELLSTTETSPLLNLEERSTIKSATANEVESEGMTNTGQFIHFSDDQQVDGSSKPNVPLHKLEQTPSLPADETQTSKRETTPDATENLNKKTESSSIELIEQKPSKETENLPETLFPSNSSENKAKDQISLDQAVDVKLMKRAEKRRVRFSVDTVLIPQYLKSTSVPIKPAKQKPKCTTNSNEEEGPSESQKISDDSEAKSLRKKSEKRRARFSIDVASLPKSNFSNPTVPMKKSIEQLTCEGGNFTETPSPEECPTTKKETTSVEVKEIKSHKKSEKRRMRFSVDEAPPKPDSRSETSVPIEISKQISETSCTTVTMTETTPCLTSDDVVVEKLIKKSEKRRVRFSIDMVPQTNDDFSKPNVPKKISKKPVCKTDCLSETPTPTVSLVGDEFPDKKSTTQAEDDVAELKLAKKSDQRRVRFSIDEAPPQPPPIIDLTNSSVHQKRSTQKPTTETKTLQEKASFHSNLEELCAKKQTTLDEAQLKSIKKSEKRRARYTIDVAPPQQTSELSTTNFTTETTKQDLQTKYETENLSETRPILSSDEYLNIKQALSDEAEVKLFKKTAIQKLIDDNERNITKKRERRKKARGTPYFDVPSTSSSGAAHHNTETNEDLLRNKITIRDTYTKRKSNARARSNSCDGLICLIKAVEAINLAANDSEHSSSNSVVDDADESKRVAFTNDKIITNTDKQNFTFDYDSNNDTTEFTINENVPNTITELANAGFKEDNSLEIAAAANAVDNIELTEKCEINQNYLINDNEAIQTNLDRLAEAAMFTEVVSQQRVDDTIDVRETEFSSTNPNMHESQNVHILPQNTISTTVDTYDSLKEAVCTLETAKPATTKTEMKMHRRLSRSAANIVPERPSATEEKIIEDNLTSRAANVLNDIVFNKKDTNTELKDEESTVKSALPKNMVSESSTTTSSDSEIETTTKRSDMLLKSEQWTVINNTGIAAASSLEHSQEDVDIKKNVDDKLNKRSIKIRLVKAKMPTKNKTEPPPIDSSTDEAVKNFESEFGDVSYRPITRKLSAALHHTLQMDTDSSIIEPIEPLKKRDRKTKTKVLQSTGSGDVSAKRRKLEEEKLQTAVKDEVIDLTLIEDDNSVKSVLAEGQSEKPISPKRKNASKRQKIENPIKAAAEKKPKEKHISDADFLEQIRIKHASNTRGAEKESTKRSMQQEIQTLETSPPENQSTKESSTTSSLGAITKRLKVAKAEKKQKEKTITDATFLECIKRKHTTKMKDTEKQAAKDKKVQLQQEIASDTEEESQLQKKTKLSKDYSNKNTNTHETLKRTDDEVLIVSKSATDSESQEQENDNNENVIATQTRKNLKNSSKNFDIAEFIQPVPGIEVDVDKSVGAGQTQQHLIELPNNDLYQKINTKNVERNLKKYLKKESVAHTDDNDEVSAVVANATVSKEEYAQKSLTELAKNCLNEDNMTNASNTFRNNACHELAPGVALESDKTVSQQQYLPNLENLLENEFNEHISSNESEANETDRWTVSSDDEESEEPPTTVRQATVTDEEVNAEQTVNEGETKQNSTEVLGNIPIDEVSTKKSNENLANSLINSTDNESNGTPKADGMVLEKFALEDKPLLADISEFTSLSLSSIKECNSNSPDRSFDNGDSDILKELENAKQNKTNHCTDMNSQQMNVETDKALKENGKFNCSDISNSSQISCSNSATTEVTSETDLCKNELTSFKVVPSETQVSELILNTSTSLQDLSLIYLENEIMSNDALLTELIMDIMTTPTLEHNYATAPNEKVMTKKYELKNYDDKQIESELVLPQNLKNKKTRQNINEEKDYQGTIKSEDNPNNEKSSINAKQLKVSIPLQNIRGLEEIKKKDKLKENWYLAEEPCTSKAAALKRREIDNLAAKASENSLKREEKKEEKERAEMQLSEYHLSRQDVKRPRTPEGEIERESYCSSPSFQMEKRRKVAGVMEYNEQGTTMLTADEENLFTNKEPESNESLDKADTNMNEDTTNTSNAMVDDELNFCENIMLENDNLEDLDTQFDKIKRNLEKEFAKIESEESRDHDEQNKSTENIQIEQKANETENSPNDKQEEDITNQQQTNRDTMGEHDNEIPELQPIVSEDCENESEKIEQFLQQELQAIVNKDCENESEKVEQLLAGENEFKDDLDVVPQTEDNQSKKISGNQQIQQGSNVSPKEKESKSENGAINEEKLDEDVNGVKVMKEAQKASSSPQNTPPTEEKVETNTTQAQTEKGIERDENTMSEQQNLQFSNDVEKGVPELNNNQSVGIKKQTSDHVIDHALIQATNIECNTKIAKSDILMDVTHDDNIRDISMAELQESAIQSLIENTNYNDNDHQSNEVTSLTHYENDFFDVNACLNDSDNVKNFKVSNNDLFTSSSPSSSTKEFGTTGVGGGFKARNDALISAQDMKDDSNDFLSIETNSIDTNLDAVTDLLKTNELIDFSTNLTNSTTSPTANTVDQSFPNASNLANIPSTTTQDDLFPNLVAPATLTTTTSPPPPAATKIRSLSLDMPSLTSCDFDMEPDTTNNPPNITDLAQINELSSCYVERESLQTPTPINQPTSSDTDIAATTKTTEANVEGDLDSTVSTSKTETAAIDEQSAELLLQKETTTKNINTAGTDGPTNTQSNSNLQEIEKADKALRSPPSSKSIKSQKLSSPSKTESSSINICSTPSSSFTPASTKTTKLTNSPFPSPSKLRLQPTRVSTRARAPARVQIVTPQRKSHDNGTTIDLNQNQISTTLPSTYPSDPSDSSATSTSASCSSPSSTATTSTSTKPLNVVKKQANILQFEKYIQKLMGLMDVSTIIKSARNLLVDKNALADAHAAILAHASQYDSEGNEISQPLILKDHKDGTISITYDNDESILLTSSLSKMVKKLSLALSILQEQQTSAGGLSKRARIEKLLKKLTETPTVVKTTQAQVLSNASAIPTAVVNPTNLAENVRDMMDLSTLNNVELFNRGSGIGGGGSGGSGVAKQLTMNQQHQATIISNSSNVQHAILHTNWRDMERNCLTKTISNGDLPLANEDQLMDIDPLPLLEDEGTAGDYEHGVAFDFEDSLTMLSTTNEQTFVNPFEDVLGGGSDGDADSANANEEENVWNNLEQNGDIMMAANWQVEDCNNDVNLWQEHNGGMDHSSSSNNKNNNNNMDVEENTNYNGDGGDDIDDDEFVFGDAAADANNHDDFGGNDQNGITEVPALSRRRQRSFDGHHLRTMQPQSLNINHSTKLTTPTAATTTPTALVERIPKMRTNIVTCASEEGIFQTPMQRRISTQNNIVNLAQQQQQQNHSTKIHYRLSVAQAAKQQQKLQQQPSQRQATSTSNSLHEQQQQSIPLTPTTTATTSHITIDNIKNIQLIAQQFPQNSIRLVLTAPLKNNNNTTNQFILATPAQQQTSFINYELQTIPTLPNLNQNYQITKIPSQPLNSTPHAHIQSNNNDDDDNTIENNIATNVDNNITSRITPQTDANLVKIIRDNRNLAANSSNTESKPTQNLNSTKTIKLPNGVEVCARRVSLSSDQSSVSTLSPSPMQQQQIQFLQATNINELLNNNNNNNQTGVKYQLIQQQTQSQGQRQTPTLKQYRLDKQNAKQQSQQQQQQQQLLKAVTTATTTTQSPTIFSTRSPRLQNRMCNVPLSPDRPTTATSTSTSTPTSTTSKTIKSHLIRKRNHCPAANYNLDYDDETYITPPINELDYTRESDSAHDITPDGANSNSYKTIILQPITATITTTTANKSNQLISKVSSSAKNFYTKMTLGSSSNNAYKLQKQRQIQQQQQHRLTLSSSAAAKSFNFRPKIMGQNAQTPSSSSNSNSNSSSSSSQK